MGAGPYKNCDVNVDLNRDFKPTVVCDAEHLPFKENTFFHIVCSHLLEHLNQPNICLLEISRVATEKSQVEIGFPLESNASNWRCLFRVLAYNLWFPALPLAYLGILRTLSMARKKPYVVLHKWILTPAYVARYLNILRICKVGSYWNQLLSIKKVKLPAQVRQILLCHGPAHSYLITATKPSCS